MARAGVAWRDRLADAELTVLERVVGWANVRLARLDGGRKDDERG